MAEVKPSKSNAEAQSLRAVAGKQFEGIVTKAVNDILNREDIYAVSLKGLNHLIKHDLSSRKFSNLRKPRFRIHANRDTK